MSKLEGKVAYVTGSGRGIGRAVALKLAREGAKVVVNDLDQEPADEVVGAIEALGGEAIAVVGSVTDADFGDKFIKAGIEAFGGVDIIVNNAGYTWDALVHKMGDDQFDAMIDVHLKAPFRVIRAASGFIRAEAEKEGSLGAVGCPQALLARSRRGREGSGGRPGGFP